MAKYINCEEALSELYLLMAEHEDDQFEGKLLHWTGIKAILERLPAADVVERKTGKWIELPPACNGAILTKCSSCKRTFTDVQLGMVKRFCPNCGARMEAD